MPRNECKKLKRLLKVTSDVGYSGFGVLCALKVRRATAHIYIYIYIYIIIYGIIYIPISIYLSTYLSIYLFIYLSISLSLSLSLCAGVS